MTDVEVGDAKDDVGFGRAADADVGRRPLWRRVTTPVLSNAVVADA